MRRAPGNLETHSDASPGQCQDHRLPVFKWRQFRGQLAARRRAIGEFHGSASVKCFRNQPCACSTTASKRSRLFEEVRGAGHDDELFFVVQLGERGAIKRQHLDIVAADNQQRRSCHHGKSRSGKISTAATRNDDRYWSLTGRFCDKRWCWRRNSR